MYRLWVCSYDITDDRRRQRAARLLLGQAERVQKSVYEAWLSAEGARSLRRDLAALLDGETDRAALFPVCADCQARVRVLGLGRRPGRPGHWCV
jgi:CRISPR-associated protein Cas2